MSKKCRKCEEIKPLQAFHKSNRHSLGVKNECALCTNAYLRAHYHNNSKIQHRANNRNNYYKREYGITYEQYLILFSSREGKCDICKTVCEPSGPELTNIKNVLAVDHCHKTGRVRGLLCQTCNQGMGLFKDDIDLLVSAHVYLLNDSDVKDEL